MVPALLGITLDKEYQQSDWSGALSKGQLDYAAHDAQVLLPLYRVLQDSLQDQGLQYIADLEGRILPMVNAMTQDGTILDMLAWIAQSDRTAEEARQTRDQLDRLLNDLRHSGDLDQQTNLNGLEAD
jgi:DNA polymerase-1